MFKKRCSILAGLCATVVLASAQPMIPNFQEMERITQSGSDTVLSRNTNGNLRYGSDGTLHLVYTERFAEGTGIGSPGTLYYRSMTSGEWTNPLAIRSQTGNRVPFDGGGNPCLFVDEKNAVHFVWHDYRNSTSDSGLNNVDIYYRKLLSNGIFEGSELQITNYEGNQWRPKIRGLDSKTLVIGWYDFFQEPAPSMAIAFSNEQGMFLENKAFEDFWIQNAKPDGSAESSSGFALGVVLPDFAFDPSAQLHSVWTTGFTETDSALFYGAFDFPFNHTLIRQMTLSETGSSFSDPPKIQTDRDGNVWVLWTERVDDLFHNIWLAKKEADASQFNEPIALTNHTTDSLVKDGNLAIGVDGNVYVVWSDKRDSDGDIFLRIWDVQSEQLSDEIRITHQIETIDTRPAIAISEQGIISIVWQTNRDGNTELYQVQSKSKSNVSHWNMLGESR